MGSLKNIDGVWFSEEKADLSYPENGNDFLYSVEDRSYWFKARNNVILNRIQKVGLPKNLQFVEIGGGNGYVSSGLQNEGYSVSLVEPGRGIFNAKKRGLKHLYCCQISDLPSNLQLSIVGLFDVVEHIAEPVPFLKQIHELMSQEGFLVVTVPAFKFLWSEEDTYAGHYRRYTRNMLEQELKTSGFEILHGTYFFSSLVPLVFFGRTLPDLIKGFFKVSKMPKQEISGIVAPPVLDWILGFVLKIELTILKLFNGLPFGSSIIIIAQKN